jgi:CRP-like cAMP-binding protein
MTGAMRGPSAHERLIRKLRAVADVSPAVARAIERMPVHAKDLAAGVDIVREKDRPAESCIVVEGWACRYKLLERGQRQILSFHLPGDMPDLQSLHLKVMDHSLATLTPARMAFVQHGALQEVLRDCPALETVFWRDTLIDAAIFRVWMAGIGRRTASQRIAHLFCELFVRLRSLGIADTEGFQLAITQAEIADALGLTSVHVNRVLKELRTAGLIATPSRSVAILNWEGLQREADFDPTYLHLKPEGLAQLQGL